jgi:hypothetical protein
VPGFATRRGEGFDGWEALLTQLKDNLKGKTGCTPILGSGLLEGLVGPTREIARRWARAEETRFPMAPHRCEDLPQVSQFLSVMQSLTYPAKALEDRFRAELGRRFEDVEHGEAASLDDLLEAARKRQPDDPHAILAQLPFPIYLTTNADDQLRRALVDVGRRPRVELCRWHARPEYDWPRSVFDPEPNSSQRPYEPTLDDPLVYYLHGQLREPDTLVLTEDDYFDYLIGATRNTQLTPSVVKASLARSALLFLGFRLEEWDFRVLFRSILAQGNRQELSNRFPHIAAQIAPEEGRHLDIERARNYLQKYFWNVRISIYWGTLEDFVRELRDRARKAGLWPYRQGVKS